MTTDLHSLMAPYALDALDPDERLRFENHVEQCPTCRSELAGFQATAARLGEAEHRTPPPGLRARLMTQIALTPQERPAVAAPAPRSVLRRTLPRLAMAAAFAIGTVGVGGFVIERNNAANQREVNEAIASVLSAADADTESKVFPTGGTVRLISSSERDAAVIFARDLPSPGRGKVYQVWMITAGKPVSQGTLVKDGQMIMQGVTKAEELAVTVEPEGGSEQPTTPPVATIGL